MLYFDSLDLNGYQVIRNVLSDREVDIGLDMFSRWHAANNVKDSAHGIIQHYGAGQSAFAWFIRTRPKVINVFKELYDTDQLVVSFDGQGYFPPGQTRRNTWWMHTDQSPVKKGRHCVQGLVSLTDNQDSGLVVIPGSHLKHHRYFASKGISHTKDWAKVDETSALKSQRHLVRLNRGDMVIWDSRLFHQNQYSDSGEMRLVQYVSYLPRSGLSEPQQKKRIKYHEEDRTTTHWAYPVRVNPLQPQLFGDESKRIDYSRLVKTDENFLIANQNAINRLI